MLRQRRPRRELVYLGVCLGMIEGIAGSAFAFGQLLESGFLEAIGAGIAILACTLPMWVPRLVIARWRAVLAVQNLAERVR